MSGWLEVLRAECDRAGQAATAKRLGLSASTVNQVLKGTYRAGTERVQALVESEFLGRTVQCPVAGEISLADCMANKARPYTPINHVWVRLWRACRNCEANA